MQGKQCNVYTPDTTNPVLTRLDAVHIHASADGVETDYLLRELGLAGLMSWSWSWS